MAPWCYRIQEALEIGSAGDAEAVDAQDEKEGLFLRRGVFKGIIQDLMGVVQKEYINRHPASKALVTRMTLTSAVYDDLQQKSFQLLHRVMQDANAVASLVRGKIVVNEVDVAVSEARDLQAPLHNCIASFRSSCGSTQQQVLQRVSDYVLRKTARECNTVRTKSDGLEAMRRVLGNFWC